MAVEIASPAPDSVPIADTTGRDASARSQEVFIQLDFSGPISSEQPLSEIKGGTLAGIAA